jgi:hypothetical protein
MDALRLFHPAFDFSFEVKFNMSLGCRVTELCSEGSLFYPLFKNSIPPSVQPVKELSPIPPLFFYLSFQTSP